MSRILIGSSNIRRFYGNVTDQPKYKIETATIYRAFEVAMEEVKDGDKIIISVIKNLIEKAISPKVEAEKMQAMTNTMATFMETIVQTSKRCPTARFALAYPLLRPAQDWMTKHEDEIKQEFEKAYNKNDLLNITKVDAILRSGQVFEKDGVHLTAKSGLKFVTDLIEMAEAAFDAEVCEINEDDNIFSKIASAGKDSASQNNLKLVHDLRKDVTEMKSWRRDLEARLNSRFSCDNLMFARMREELDAEINRKKEDRTLVMGLDEPKGLERTGQGRSEKLKKLAEDFCRKIKPDFDGQVLFATTMGRPEKGKIRIEFRLDSVEKAREIRKIFATERAAKRIAPELADLQVITVVTLATRIRLDIMKSIAARVESGTEVAYVPNFLPRPIMHIKRKSAEGEAAGSRAHIKTLTFVDSITEYGGLVGRGDLAKAYEKAKDHFKGTMSQHFLVLEESGPGEGKGGPEVVRGVKRPYRGGGYGGRGKGGRA